MTKCYKIYRKVGVRYKHWEGHFATIEEAEARMAILVAMMPCAKFKIVLGPYPAHWKPLIRTDGIVAPHTTQ